MLNTYIPKSEYIFQLKLQIKKLTGDDTMKLIDIYDNISLKYMGSFEQTDENIINYVAAIPQFKFIRLVELSSDEIVLTTIGNFLDYVPDQNWLEKIRPSLIAKQMKEDVIDEVVIIDRYKDDEYF